MFLGGQLDREPLHEQLNTAVNTVLSVYNNYDDFSGSVHRSLNKHLGCMGFDYLRYLLRLLPDNLLQTRIQSHLRRADTNSLSN